MRLEVRKLLHDVLTASRAIQEFTRGKTESAYRASDLLRSATERKFEIIGEALTRMRDLDGETFAHISEAHPIVGFRNRIIHGYDSVDDGIVWDVTQTKLPILIAEVEKLLAEDPPKP
jgi:uncharacterized protein with HEPN domain